MMTIEQQQCLLGCLGYYRLRRQDGTLAVDGLNGPSTKNAIMQFQKEHRERPDGTFLWVDGVWGPATEAAIRQVIGTNEQPQIEELDPADPKEIPKLVWQALISQGLPPEAAAGIMGNLDAESAMSSINLENQYANKTGFTDLSYTEAVDNGTYTNFGNDRFGYGLCQWTYPTRKAKLLQYAKDTGCSIGDPEMQIAFLIKEMREMYSGLLSRLMRSKSVYGATRDFMLTFESPADQSDTAVARRTSISQIYFQRYT